VEQALAAVRGGAPWPARLIVEAETAAEAAAAVAGGADAVLLDGFPAAALATLVPQLRLLAWQRGAPVVLEASGIDPDQLSAYAASGIDLISTSAPVTRSPWLDLSMRFTGGEAIDAG
jgi:nicotinate-nucleotide pyrophosphorylase (carboxylating)